MSDCESVRGEVAEIDEGWFDCCFFRADATKAGEKRERKGPSAKDFIKIC